MTIEEALVCAEIYTESLRDRVPDKTIALARVALKNACPKFPAVIGMIDPGDMDRLFVFFRALLFRITEERLCELLGIDTGTVLDEFEEQFVTPLQHQHEISDDEEQRFRELIGKLEIG